MHRPFLYIAMAATIGIAALEVSAVGVGNQEATGDSSRPAPSSQQIYEETDRPLDGRIKLERVTESELPSLPERVVLPMPPTFSLSTSADQVPISEGHWKQARDAVAKGLAYLRSQQDKRGGWLTDLHAAPTDQPENPSPVGIAVTALAVKAFAQAEENALEDNSIRIALRLILSAREDDGSFGGGDLSNYVTSSVLMGLASVEDHDFDDAIGESVKWLTVNQWDQSEGLSPRQDWFGGAGYGNRGRPDLSNTQMMLDALYDAGLSPDEPAMQKALAFASRTQNLKSTNHADWAGTDGGFVYTPANGGESFASESAGEGRQGELISAGQPRSLRSYGSMTYAGFKSMLYAGLSPDDVRVRAAFDWIRHHWTFDENPGVGQQGLFYYYHTMARALAVAQQNEITDTSGTKHNWREELIDALIKRQRDDGSWVNDADRWLEGEPVLATVYAVLALQETLKAVAIPPDPARNP